VVTPSALLWDGNDLLSCECSAEVDELDERDLDLVPFDSDASFGESFGT